MIAIKPGVYNIPILEDWIEFYKKLKPNYTERAILLAESKWRVYDEYFCVEVLNTSTFGGYTFMTGLMCWYVAMNKDITIYKSNTYEVDLL